MLDITQAAHAFTQLLVSRGMGDRSLYALHVAVEAATMEGVGGVIAVSIPPKNKDRLDAVFSTSVRSVAFQNDWS